MGNMDLKKKRNLDTTNADTINPSKSNRCK